MPASERRTTRRRAFAGLAGGLGVGAVGGFVGSLLRRRRGSSYARALRQPDPPDDIPDDTADERDH